MLSKHFEVTVDFFASYHGKSICDSWFSLLTAIYEMHSKYHEDTMIASTSDLISLLETGLKQCNANTNERNKHKKPTAGNFIGSNNFVALEELLNFEILEYFREESICYNIII